MIEVTEPVIDWSSSDSHILLNPRLPQEDRRLFEQAVAQLPALTSHIWLSTSGTTQRRKYKLVALSKEAFLNSATASNIHLESSSDDIWLNVLPFFHVGGISIHARAFVSGARVVTSELWKKWQVDQFYNEMERAQATLCSLVPTQVFDLVQSGLPSPQHLRAVLVGGGALNQDLYFKARDLGWPLLPTYGMTECCSQVATASLASLNQKTYPKLELLGHVNGRVSAEEYLELSSSSLLSGWCLIDSAGSTYEDPKEDGWYRTQDRAEVHGRTLVVKGRSKDQVKIGGELVNLAHLQSRLEQQMIEFSFNVTTILLFAPSSRLGHEVILVSEEKDLEAVEKLTVAFNQRVLPYERIRQMYLVDHIPRTALGKVQTAELLADLGFKSLS